jgi:cysteine desulfurase
MAANNEIGVVQPIEEIGAVCRKHDILFHTDAAQAVGKIPINVTRMGIDLLSMSGHKVKTSADRTPTRLAREFQKAA